MAYSMNPYQGCEHGCIYCYARNTHEYYGFSAGLDFESKIIVKKNAPQILEQQLLGKNWNASPIMLSGNTDCYQPQERKFQITRQILQDLAADNLVHVMISITTLNEDLRRIMEPRTASSIKRLKTVEELAKAN